MARYRKVEVAMWNDEKFCSLSAAPPNAQTLWLYLLTGPRTTSLPGLLIARDVVMASDLDWPVEGFLKAFREASAKGLVKADWKAGVVVLRKALIDSTGEPRDTSRPESPNVIKKWAKSWDEVPECSLKDEYLRTLESFTKALGEAFLKAFLEGFRKALAKASADPSSNQEQEQEQEQECLSPPAPHTPKAKARPAKTPLPADWEPIDSHRSKASELGLNCEHEAEQFRNGALAHARRYVDWDAAFHNWLGTAAKWRDERGGQRTPTTSPGGFTPPRLLG